MTVAVAICTYNRCESLWQTLESLTRLEMPAKLGWELEDEDFRYYPNL